MNSSLLVCIVFLLQDSGADRLDGLLHDHHHEHDHALHRHHARSSSLALEPARRQQEQVVDEPPRPYTFSYEAGRYPHHVDRKHSESRDSDGTVVGSYEYLDPLRRLVKVDYTVDANGFQPVVQGPVPKKPRESKAVSRARQRHFDLSAKIAEQQARIAQHHAALRESRDQQSEYNSEAHCPI